MIHNIEMLILMQKPKAITSKVFIKNSDTEDPKAKYSDQSANEKKKRKSKFSSVNQ